MYGMFALPGTESRRDGSGSVAVPSGQRVGLRNTHDPQAGQLCVELVEAGAQVLRFDGDGEPTEVDGVFLSEVFEEEVEGCRVVIVKCVRG